MPFKIFHDIEQGLSVLIGAPDNPDIGFGDLPAEVKAPVERFAEGLGMEVEKLSEAHNGALFDIMDKAVDAVHEVESNAPGHAAAGEAAATGDAPLMPKEPTKPIEQDPAAIRAEQEAASAQTGAQSATGADSAGSGESHPGEPVTTPTAGHTICPTCAGFRTEVTAQGATVVCTTCQGKGEVPAAPGAGG